MIRKYHDHRIIDTSRESIDQKLLLPSQTPDRNYMKMQMEPHIKFLDSSGVRDLSSFYQTIHEYGFKSKDQEGLINYYSQYLHLNLLKKRELRKSNAGEKNILLNVIALQYPDAFNCLLRSYVNDKFPEMNDKDAFFQDIMRKTNQLHERKASTIQDQRIFEVEDFFKNDFEDDQFVESFSFEFFDSDL